MYWTRLVLVRPAASLYSASTLKHHPTGKQWCPNPGHYCDSELARRSLTLLCWALSRAKEPQIFTSFVWLGRGSNHQPPACQANAQPLHYPAAVFDEEGIADGEKLGASVEAALANVQTVCSEKIQIPRTLEHECETETDSDMDYYSPNSPGHWLYYTMLHGTRGVVNLQILMLPEVVLIVLLDLEYGTMLVLLSSQFLQGAQFFYMFVPGTCSK